MSNIGKQTILVIGATGAQGGSVARHLLARNQFAVRALTRHPDSQNGRQLRRAGVEVVYGDLDDRESLRAALGGCYGCYGVTNYYEHFGHEYDQGKSLIDTVAAAGVQHFVFSALPPVKQATGGELAVPHFDIKARLEDEARARALPATYVHPAFYFDNFITYFPPRAQADGRLAIGFPQGDTPLAGVASEDIGGVVAAIFERREAFLGAAVDIVGDYRRPQAYAEIMSRVLGAQVVYNHIPRDVFASLGFPGAEETANMFEFYRTRVPDQRVAIERSRALYPDMQSFESWLERHAEQFVSLVQPRAGGSDAA
ncbi:MAG: NmrA/HSCARG family protein [Kouleothrix sp.]|nr:NmrA/HSCARG family protein [Kouleothrix sp.]